MQSKRGNTSTLLVTLLSLLCLTVAPSAAQDTSNARNIGLPPNGVFSGSEFDVVQLNNLDLHIEIPLWSTPGRGLPVSFKYVYDNKGWYFDSHCNRFGYCTDTVAKEPGNNMQWKVADPTGFSITYKSVVQLCSNVSTMTYTNYIVRGADGTKHHFVPDPAKAGSSASPCGPLGTMYAEDGSSWILKVNTSTGVPLYAVRNDGTTVNPYYNPNSQWASNGTLVRDPNGNQIIRPGDGSGTATDTLGRTFATSGLTYYDSQGTAQTIQITYTTVAVQTTLCVIPGSPGDACNEYSGNWSMPQQITFPNGMSYTFTYAQNGFGEPTSVTLPTGGQISWTWGTPIDDGGRAVATRTVTADGQSSTWTYGSPGFQGFTDPFGNATRKTCTYYGSLCYVTKLENFLGSAATGQLLKTVQTDYTTDNSHLPIRDTTTWNQDNLVTKVETDYEATFSVSPVQTARRGNAIERREYAFGTGTPGALARKTTFSYLHSSNTTYKNLNIVNRPTTKITYDGAGVIKAQTQYTYDGTALTATSGAPNHDYTGFGSGYLTRGNATQVKNWLNTSGTYLITNNAYDDLGNLRTSTDPGGHSTTFYYTDNWSGTGCVGSNTQAYITQTNGALGHRSQTMYFPCTGLAQKTRDESDILAGIWGQTFSYDQMNRVLSVVQSDGGETDFTYNDVAPVSVTATTKITGSMNLVSTSIRDGLGRVEQTQLASDPDGATFTDTTYDALGRTATVSNPYRSGGTIYVTTTQYDALSRVTKVIPTDGTDTTNNVTSVYTANTVTVTDQAGKKRKSQTDALGRLTAVWEPNAGGSFIYETDYQYDTLDNLTRVDQKGNDGNSANWRTRTFTYNSLSQLLTASNPESGTINYTYDNDGNLLTKVAPLPNQTGSSTVTTTYSYDAIHRLTGKTYSNGDPAVSYFYDQISYNGLTITNGSGRRTGMSDGSGMTAWSFDSEGRALTERRTISGITKSIGYAYNLDGSLASLIYPSGRTVNYAYNAVARPLSAIDAANSINYATVATYAPQGALAGVKYGVTGSFTGIVTSNTYNPRLQPVVISATAPSQTVLSLSYGFGLGTADNGNVLQIQNNMDASRTQTFTYDELNRVKTAEVPTAWGLSFGYDIWANLLSQAVTKGSAPMLNVAANTKNQISGFCYDAAGNLLGETSCSAYAYDAENRMTASAAGGQYFYDGDGKRVKKSSGTLYWTGIGSDALAESDLAANFTDEYVFFAGKRIARRKSTGEVNYYFADHLGTSRIVTNATGTLLDDADFYPFGGERPILSSSGNNYKFTGKERDAETGLDYFGARYLSSNLARFVSSDPLMASARVGQPQSWNRYAFTLNNPLRFVDPNGMEVPESCAKDPSCKITLNLNVIYDKNANEGKGLTDEQKQEFEKKQLAEARERYGVANIEINTTYTEGTWKVNDKGNVVIEGARSDSLNVVLSDRTPTGEAGVSGNNPAGIIVNVNEMQNFDVPILATRTLPHEMAHHMLDHVLRSPRGFFDKLSRDWNADFFATGVGDPQTLFIYRQHTQNKAYAVPANPEANKPDSK